MGEWTAISLDWWKGEESERERKYEAGQMIVSCINTKGYMQLSIASSGKVALKYPAPSSNATLCFFSY